MCRNERRQQCPVNNVMSKMSRRQYRQYRQYAVSIFLQLTYAGSILHVISSFYVLSVIQIKFQLKIWTSLFFVSIYAYEEFSL